MSVNQEGYELRLQVVQQILAQFGLKSTKVTPVAYVEHSPFHFNNFIYKIDLAQPAFPNSFPGKQPGTSAAPAEGIATLAVRLSNARAEGLNNTNRVENEVGAQYLARKSLEAAGLAPVVPAVYAWSPCRYLEVPNENGFGWFVSEFKDGEDLDSHFSSLSIANKREVIGQIADLFAAIQRAQIPEGVTGFGALTFDAHGNLVSGEMPLLTGGPWQSYAEAWKQRLQSELRNAEKSQLLRGWEDEGLRKELDQFLESRGVEKLLTGVDINQRTLVHGDFTMNNMLFDSTTKRVTSVLDFDWSCVTHPGEEFFSGLWDLGGGFDDRTEDIQGSILTGNFDTTHEFASGQDAEKWEVAKAWNEAASRRGILRPSSIRGMENLLALKDLEGMLCPFALSNEHMLRRASELDKCQQKKDLEEKIRAWLKVHQI